MTASSQTYSGLTSFHKSLLFLPIAVEISSRELLFNNGEARKATCRKQDQAHDGYKSDSEQMDKWSDMVLKNEIWVQFLDKIFFNAFTLNDSKYLECGLGSRAKCIAVACISGVSNQRKNDIVSIANT